ncbi:MAG: MotA/TolQ/ExbB proton channel family protein [Myxococcales bacterium]|nr:hypothetical protein [Myxococcales bacterium]
MKSRTGTIGFIVSTLLLASLLAGTSASAQNSPAAAEAGSTATSLDELLQRVRSGWEAERAENREREVVFKRAQQDQRRLLTEAEQALSRLEKRSEELELEFQTHEGVLAELAEVLRERLGVLGELFGVVRQVSGDTAGLLEASFSSAEIPGRSEFLVELGKSKSLPKIEELERLWFELQREMTESGKVVRFRAVVISPDGTESEREVTRIGLFNAVSSGRYLNWDDRVHRLTELPRQPSGRYLSTVSEFESASGGRTVLAIDPSRGVLLESLMETPSRQERVAQGGVIGYTVLGLGFIAGIVAIVRLVQLVQVSRKVRSQRQNIETLGENPLGRVLGVYEESRDADPEALELKLDEAVLRESARLVKFLWVVKVVSVVAPLMGLLGTVTGMIQTFQIITLFGTGDPRLMAGGISEALVTTMLGLVVAIPLVLLHSAVASLAQGVVDVLQEMSVGLVARRMEGSDA